MKANYGSIRYPFHRLKPSQSVLDAYPELDLDIFHATEKEFMVTEVDEEGEEKRVKKTVTLGTLDNEFVMRYIILMYAMGSPAVENYPQLGKRKTWVLKELGVKPNSVSKYEGDVNAMLINKNRLILQKIAVFLTLQQPSSWAVMLKAQEDLQEILSMPLPEDPTKQMNRQKVIEALMKSIEDCKQKLMEFESSKLVEQELTEFMAYVTLGIRPEERVMAGVKAVAPKDAKANVLFPEVGN